MTRYFLLSLLLLIASIPAVSASEVITFTIADQPYKALLTENTRLNQTTLPANQSNAKHYRGKLIADPKSWLRVSHINNQWQGVISAFGALYIISPTADEQMGARKTTGSTTAPRTSTATNTPLHPVAHNANDLQRFTGKRCGTSDKNSFSQHMRSSLSRAGRQYAATPFASLCSTTLNGKCLTADIEFAFDQFFKDQYPSTYTDQANSIINIAEGFFVNDFKVGFETLSLTFIDDDATPAGNIFTESTNIDTLLTDIQNKKSNNTINFLTNRNALFHLTSGRNFDAGIIGTAFDNGLCAAPNTGENTSTTQIHIDIPTTAILVAHELGHNFGALHDNIPASSCKVNNFIMNASINPTATNFSTCSISDIKDYISTITSPLQCLNQPVDMQITADASNLSVQPINQPFTNLYHIDTQEGSEKIQTARITGEFKESGSEFMTVTLNGNPCTITNKSNYSCSIEGGSLPARQVLSVNAISSRDSANLEQVITVLSPDTISDTNTGNNTLTELITLAQVVPPAPTNLLITTKNTETFLRWQDNAFNEDNYRVERRLSNTNTWETLSTLNADTIEYTDTNVTLNTTYVYRVIASNNIGDSLPSNEALVYVKENAIADTIKNKKSGGLDLTAIFLLLNILIIRTILTVFLTAKHTIASKKQRSCKYAS